MQTNKALRLDYQETTIADAYGHAAPATPAPARPAHMSPQVDVLLMPFINASDRVACDDALEHLITEALPIIRGVIKSKLRVSLVGADGRTENQDELEISCEIQVNLITALRELQAGRRASIGNFQSYVAVIAYNACYDYLRRKHPRRHSLKNKLRYLLTHRPGFSAWEIDGVTFCGLTAWRFQKRAPVESGQLRRALKGEDHAPQSNAAPAYARALSLTDLTSELFRKLSGPVELDELVGVVADLQEVKEDKPQGVEDREESTGAGRGCESLPCSGMDPAEEVERRLQLKRLWAEICQLPPYQRAALLLNLRDTEGCGTAVVNLLPVTGVASIREVAAALEMPAEELAVLWAELPLDDACVAARLGITRQQVINLRKSARERLARRMKAGW